VPKSDCSISAYADVKASSCQSKPPQRSATAVSIGSRIVRNRASSSLDPRVRARARRSQRRARDGGRRSRCACREPAQRRRLLVDEAADERPVLVERGSSTRRMLLERERELGASLDRERREAERAQ
jgi:hypothetical protein